MKTDRSYPKLYITKKGEGWLETGHPWIYSEEVICPQSGSEEVIENGSVVDAVSVNGKYLGSGFYSRFSKIRIRLISRNANDLFDEKFWARRVSYALDYRMTVMQDNTDAFRIIFGEADGFPGLTVDKFHDILVAQVLSAGMEKIKGMLFMIIAEELRKRSFSVAGIYERNDAAIRKLEGLEQYKGWFELPGTLLPYSAVTEGDRLCMN